MASIYEYDEYREYLRDKFTYLKSTYKKMSLEFLAKKIGISKSFLKMVLDGERHLSMDKLVSVVKAFEMSRDEKSFFIFLACKNMVDDKDMNSFFGNLLKILSTHKGAYFPTPEEIKVDRTVYASSLSMIIQTMRQLDGYQEDAVWIKKHLKDQKISLKEIQEVLANLKQNEVTNSRPQGVLYPTYDGFMRTRVGLKLASEVCAAPLTYRPLKSFMVTYTLDNESHDKAFEIFTEMHDKLEALEQRCKKPTMVLFASNNMFTVADTIPPKPSDLDSST
ncbi:TIGR02147 family protein [Bdellovibrio bacteriovorus]|uniref:TIGR02147 family protein n=1 Tax=Bdellovibrio TaxID=958 RepID=UPI0035A823D3